MLLLLLLLLCLPLLQCNPSWCLLSQLPAIAAAHAVTCLYAAAAQILASSQSNMIQNFGSTLITTDECICGWAGNSRHIQSIITLAAALRGPLEDPLQLQPAQRGQQSIQTVNEFLFVSHLDGVNMFKLVR